MRITVPHYFDFGPDRDLVGDNLVRPEAWDAIRTQTNGPFALPATRSEWESALDEHPEFEARAERIVELLAGRSVAASPLASYGAGGAFVEGWLKRLQPERPLLIGEYAPATVARLGDVFGEVQVLRHDLLADPPLDAKWHLFHRIDTEFSNRTWRKILGRFGQSNVLVVATEVIDFHRATSELRTGLRNRNATRCGHVRNRAAFEGLWRRSHDAERVRVADLHGWVLTPKHG